MISLLAAIGDKPAKLTGIQTVIISILGVLARLIGIIAFVMLIIGGYQYLTASGDPKKAELAQKTLTGAFVGIGLVIGGWLLLRLIEAVTGVNITQFTICITGGGPNCLQGAKI